MHSDSANTYKPGSWGQAAAPPPPVAEAEPFSVPTGNVEVIPAPVAAVPPPVLEPMPPPLVSPPPTPPATDALQPVTQVATAPPTMAAAAAAPEDDAGSGIRLGFADGSDLQLDPEHPHSLALRAVADILLHRGPSRRRAG